VRFQPSERLKEKRHNHPILTFSNVPITYNTMVENVIEEDRMLKYPGENDEVEFPDSYSAEEVLKSLILHLKPLIVSIDGSVDMLGRDAYKELAEENIQRIGRCVKLIRRTIDSAEKYSRNKKAGCS